MIVYGEPSIEIAPTAFIAGLRRRVAEGPWSCEAARVLLVLAGQLEQAVEDQGLDVAPHCRAFTAAVAEDFVRQWRGDAPDVQGRVRMRRRLDRIARSLPAHPPMLGVRTPEGFAFYGLFPDAYAQAAEQWARAIARSDRVLVVGLRSIGTSLSAVVAAVLATQGVRASAISVRPGGHPFRRVTRLPAAPPKADRVAIVDEGPGLSGSSMVSVAEALLMQAGYRRDAIAFFPGHGHGPGRRASPQVRRWWSEAPLRCVAWEDLRIGGRAASQRLLDLAGSLIGAAVDAPLADIGAGRWRGAANAFGPMHARAPFLEQPKLLARNAKGAILFKFAGFALSQNRGRRDIAASCEVKRARLAALAAAGMTVPPLASADGWLALPWIDGLRLEVADGPQVLPALGRYIRAAAGPPLAATEAERASQRLRQILVCNTRALLGNKAADCAAAAAGRLAAATLKARLPAAGDGRLAPHEWIKTHSGILKLDAGGHDDDHTAVGVQPLPWDVAGALVEWNFGPAACQQLARATGCDGAQTPYYIAAYACFRAGVAALAAELAAPAEQAQFASAVAYYRDHLRRALLVLDAHRR